MIDTLTLIKLSQQFGYRAIPQSERVMLDAVAIDKDGENTDKLVEFAAVLEFVEKNPRIVMGKKDQVELSDYDTNKGTCLSLWSDDVEQIEKFRAVCRMNLPKSLGWFHQCNAQSYQMFEFWTPQNSLMRNIAQRIADDMKLPCIAILQKDYPDREAPTLLLGNNREQLFKPFDPDWHYEQGNFYGN